MSMRGTIIATVLGGAILVVAPAWTGHSPRFIWNVSASAPVGLYRIERTHRIEVADIVVVKAPDLLAGFLAERGYLPNGVPLLKRLLALGGQTVCRRGTAIIAYGTTYGTARERDSRGRPLPVWQGCRVIADGEVFLMNWDAPDSFDSRYFGPLPLTSIIGRAVPLWTTDGGTDPASETTAPVRDAP
jgi:conjugative transfer signal peptidase TraF